mmetsp:Transcript_138039/g.257498  ORF Transcript_138039/g.257498 Transcript_138039/m.257498 type:complete len:90 (+) Transcript_138039:511-780(+)
MLKFKYFKNSGQQSVFDSSELGRLTLKASKKHSESCQTGSMQALTNPGRSENSSERGSPRSESNQPKSADTRLVITFQWQKFELSYRSH